MDDLENAPIEVNPPPAGDKPEKERNKVSAFASDVFKLVSGTAFVQIESFLASIIFVRIFMPEDYGISTLFTSITGVLAVIVCLRYEVSLMLPKSHEEGANMLAASLLIAVIFSLALYPILYLARDEIVTLLKAPELGAYLWLVPIATFFLGAGTALGFWNSRTRRYLRQSSNKVINQMVADGTRGALALAGQINGGSLVYAIFSGSAISTIQLAVRTWRDDSQLFLRGVTLSKMLAGIRRYKKFPLLNSWAALLSTASTQMPSFLLAAYFSTQVTGYYGVGQRILRLPVSLIGGAIGQVFYQRASQARYQGNLPKLVEQTFYRLIIFGMFPMLLLTVAGREIFIVFFGLKWAEAGNYSQILGLWTFFLFIGSPLSSLSNLLERQEISLLLNLFLFVTRVGSLVIGGVRQDVYLGLWLFAISGFLAYGWFSLWATTAAGVPLRVILGHFFGNLLFCAPFIGTVLVCKHILRLGPVWIVVISALAGLAYYAITVQKDQELKSTLLALYHKYLKRKPSTG